MCIWISVRCRIKGESCKRNVRTPAGAHETANVVERGTRPEVDSLKAGLNNSAVFKTFQLISSARTGRQRWW